MRGASAVVWGGVAVIVVIAAFGRRLAADGGSPMPYTPPPVPEPPYQPPPVGPGVRAPIVTSTPRPVPFKRPFEIWERYKDRFGFGSVFDPQVETAGERMKSLIEKRKELRKKYENSKDKEEKLLLKKDLEDLEKDICMANLLPKGKTAEEQRQAFIEDTVDALVLAMGGDEPGLLPDFQCSRGTVLEDLEKILKEIGAEAAPGLWKMLSEQVRFRTADGQNRKAELQARIAELHTQIKLLSEEFAKTKDPEERTKIQTRRADIDYRIDGIERACKVVQRAIGGTNQKVIDKLEELLSALGADAVPALLIGAGEQNPAAVQEATGLTARLGIKAVPRLIEGLKDEKTFRAAARLLKQTTRQDLGDDAKAWTEWYEKATKGK